MQHDWPGQFVGQASNIQTLCSRVDNKNVKEIGL
jgi:hypothetical protein